MSTQIKATLSSHATYYVMNMKNDRWVKISDTYFNLEEAQIAYSELLKMYPFARLGGGNNLAVKSKAASE